MKFFSTIFSKQVNLVLFFSLSITFISFAQQTKITEYVLYGGNKSIQGQTAPPLPGYGVVLGSQANVQTGNVGSNYQIKTTGNVTISGNIISGDSIVLGSNIKITGKISAANASGTPGNVLLVGSSANLAGNIDVKGNIKIGGGTVSGKVTHPAGTTYTGPSPSGGNIIGTPVLPGLPVMPPITNFPAAGLTNINTTQSISPGSYGNVALTGNKTLTFTGGGIYVFNSIKNTGTSNSILYDFKNSATATIKIYVIGDIDLNKIKVSMINGGAASRIYWETHGKGLSSPTGNIAFNIANGTSNDDSKWLGTVWAPYAAINMGSGDSDFSLTGALWSGTQVNFKGEANIVLSPFPVCDATAIANAGPDKPLEFGNATVLNGSSGTPGATFSWQALNGGVISGNANTSTISISAAGTYVLTVSSANYCPATDTAIVTGKLASIIGSELESIVKNNSTSSPFFSIQNGKILVDVIVISQSIYSTALSALTGTYGMTGIISNGLSPLTITGYVPLSNLVVLNSRTDLFVYVRPYYGALSNAGVVTSAGDISIKSNLARGGFNLFGQGVKVGVISDSYNTIGSGGSSPKTNTATQDIGNDDLPATGVSVLQDAPFQRTDEGRAMLQIVHDIAPKADLAFRTGFNTAGDMAQGIIDLKNAGCNVIVDDVTFITEPFLKDGVIANAVNTVANAGVTYFSAAGNFANKSYENNFNAVNPPSGLGGKAHNFAGAGTDILQNVTLAPGDYTIVLQWVDNIYSLTQSGTQNDLDIYLTPDGTSLFGFNRNNTGGDPIEFLPFTVGTATTTNIMIVNNSATPTANLRFKYIVFRGNITFNEYATGQSTIVGQSNAAGAIAIGAARYDKVPPLATGYTLETFSSVGGTQVNGITINKPDFVAPDGVNTTVNLGADYDGDTYSNFFGTSAAAPHAAAVAALLMEGRKKYLNQNSSPEDIRSLLLKSAHPMGVPGSGNGFIDADLALRCIATPKDSLISLVVPGGVTPGLAPFTLTITGKYFSPTSVAYYRDIPLTTTFVNSETVTVTMPTFIGNPPFKVCTPSISSSGLDGGCSNVLYLNSPVKKNVSVTADNKNKKYGQSMPPLTAAVLVDGLPTNLPLTNLGLAPMTITTAANEGSDVGTYAITPLRSFNASNANDVGYLELYNYVFNNGTITIDQLPVTITANAINSTYGEKLPNITFNYSFDQTGIPNPSAFLNTIKNSYESSLAKDGANNDVLGLVNAAPVSIFNGVAVPIVNGQVVSIVNGQYVTIVNGVGVPIVNGQSITIVNGMASGLNEQQLSPAQVNNLSFLISNDALQNARSLTNQKLVNGAYVPQSTSVIDIAQESLFDFNANSSQTNLLQNAAASRAIGIVNQQAYSNGTAVTITNGAVSIVNGVPVSIVNGVVSIVNGASVSIVNGQSVSIVNGVAVTIVNGVAVPIVNSLDRNGVIFNSNEVGQGIKVLKSLNTVTGNNVGSNYIIPGTFNNRNFLINYVPGNLNISPASVTITPQAGQSKTYGEIDPVFVYTNNASLPGTAFSGSLGRSNNENVGNYPFNLGNLSAGANYTLSLNNINPFAIDQKAVSVIASPGQSKSYGSNDPSSYSFTSSPAVGAALANGNVISFTGALSRASGENVGTYGINQNTLANSNYLINYTSADFSISKLSVNVTTTPGQTKVYGSTDPSSFTFTSSPAVGAPLANGEVISFTGALSRVSGETVGSYGINQNTLTNSNYTINYISAVFSISKLGVNVTATPGQTKVYGSTDPSSYTFTSNPAVGALLANGDVISFTGALSRASGEAVGTYGINQNTLANSNYMINYNSADFSISKLSVNVTATHGQNKVYGSADPSSFTFTSSPAIGTPLANGEVISFTGALSRTSGENVGNYGINQNTLTNPNYTISYTGSDFIITKKTVTILPVAGQFKIYSSPDPVFTFANDAGLTLNAFTGKLSRQVGEDAGTYSFNLGTLSAGNNYSLSLNSTNMFSINAKSLTITPGAGQKKKVGAVDPVFTFTNSLSLSLTAFTGKLGRVAGETIGSYAYTLGNLSAGNNYTLTLNTAGNTIKFTIYQSEDESDHVQAPHYGIAQLKGTHQAVMYPNPATTEFTLDAGTEIKGELQIVDVNGKEVHGQNFVQPSLYSARVNVSNLSNGIYFVRWNTNEGIKAFRFIKL